MSHHACYGTLYNRTPNGAFKYRFWTLEWTQGSQTNFFLFSIYKWAKSFNLICHTRWFSWLYTIEPPMGPPKTPFWALEWTQGSQTNFFLFSIYKWAKSFNLICHTRWFSWLYTIEPPMGPPKTPFWALQWTQGSETHFFSDILTEGVKSFCLICHKAGFSQFL